MTHRTDRIWLSADEPRCEPRNPCNLKENCARYRAELPPSGAVLIGFGLPIALYGPDFCQHYISTRKGDLRVVPKPVKPAVKGIA